MFFKRINRYNPKTGNREDYYSLVESYRNSLGEPSHRTILSLGYNIDNELPFREISDRLNDLISKHQNPSLFPLSKTAEEFAQSLYTRLCKEQKIDVIEKIHKTNGDWETVDLQTLKNENVRELGAEWLCLQALEELGLSELLHTIGWEEKSIQLALSQIVSRAVYPASELKTTKFMQENSSICELTGYPIEEIKKDKLYKISKKLYQEKERLENYLSVKTNTMFDLTDNIILFDLTNTYFEGSKRTSELASYGRSKEKRSDCPLVVLALVVNVEGFIKYSAIYKGNMSDCKTLSDIIDNLRTVTSTSEKRAIVVIDAGIATKDNLVLLKEKHYDYVCVSRSNLKHYKEVSTEPVRVKDSREREIELREITVENGDSEYYLKVDSPLKALKESAMDNQFIKRFEEELTKISTGIHKKGCVKNYRKICERIGRLKSKYPSVNNLFSIEIEQGDKDKCSEVKWEKRTISIEEKREEHGVYFLKTSLKKAENAKSQETLIWTIYNCIRNIESSFRTLKTDLDLRPIYHKTDTACEAHLHLGLLAYWLVNTVRYKLKQHNIRYQWKEIVRIMNTQKVVTTSVENDKNQTVLIRKCSEPQEKAKLIYDTLGYKYAPFIRKKSVVNRTKLKKIEIADLRKINTG